MYVVAVQTGISAFAEPKHHTSHLTQRQCSRLVKGACCEVYPSSLSRTFTLSESAQNHLYHIATVDSRAVMLTALRGAEKRQFTRDELHGVTKQLQPNALKEIIAQLGVCSLCCWLRVLSVLAGCRCEGQHRFGNINL